ncbi:ATP-dependent nuclease [Marinomonas ostreistagni]|uniref:ATP-dependent nuclease n=1 Tax=Marinomonas ostreistagni TaxID=359209 RepID=UPI00194EFC8F|nr:ATP-binding protein [Marinomonas ostreistagni]MBM6551832.1 AAA family ATPase [Marinomonas ostreistagni]
MKIDSIKLSGWRSYDLNGVSIKNLKSINLIIGPNNSGKSNLAKYFNYLKSIASEKLAVGAAISFASELDESQTWNWRKERINCEITLSKDNLITGDEKVSYKVNENEVRLDCYHDVNSNTSFLNMKVNDKPLFNESNLICSDFENGSWIDPTDYVAGFNDNYFYWRGFLNSLVFVDPIRHHSRNSKNEHSYYFDGAEIIKELDKLRLDRANPSNWAGYKKQIKIWLTDILSEQVANVDVVDKDLNLEFESGLSFSLDQLGTGVSQIIMLLSHLWINKEVNLNVFLEEPEANLHPEAVVKLISIFEKELINHRFFITTHSPSLIDCLNEKWAVYRTLKLPDGSSSITPNDNVIKYYETLDSLGVKASQILQSNTVLWVEGPSDRIYLKKWIDIYSDGELKEGKDYSFLYFGGTNLASFTVLDDIGDNLINILSTSRKACLIADSDCSSQIERDDEGFKAYLSSMLDKLRTANDNNAGLDSTVEDYVKVWITEGREIENYICKNLLFDILTSKGFKRESIGQKDNYKKLSLKTTQASEFLFGEFDSFDKAISKFYQFEDGSQLDDLSLNNIALHYAGKKVVIAKALVDRLDKTHCSILDLEDKLKDLVDFIRR